MKVLTLFNKRRRWGGEDVVVDALQQALRSRGVEVHAWIRDLAELNAGVRGKLEALASSVYSRRSGEAMDRLLDGIAPDVVHAHNLYPLLSPSVLAACRHRGVATVLHCHSFLLTCPITLHYTGGEVCERCLGGREYWCALKNCRGSWPESVAYAVRNAVSRRLRLFQDNVDVFVTPSEFTKARLVASGLPADGVEVLPNWVTLPDEPTDPARGDTVLFVGRLSPEKGVDTLIAAAGRLPGVPMVIAGDGPLLRELRAVAPDQVSFAGWTPRELLPGLYRRARLAVVPSRCFETFGLVAAEAMSHGLPVVASRRGALAEVVEDGVTGLLFEPGDPADLAAKVQALWESPELCRRLGEAGRRKVACDFSEDASFQKLMAIYGTARTRAERRGNS
jgi:glycosyltransferase involved in cell wall biosynthesis